MPAVASARANNAADGQKDRQVCRPSRCPGSNNSASSPGTQAGSSLQADRSGAFTLVELLVVIAIIGILAALLLPALTRSKSAAQGVVCLNNLSQITKALYQYTMDNQDFLPANDPAYYYGEWVSGRMCPVSQFADGWGWNWQDTTNYGLLDNSFPLGGYLDDLAGGVSSATPKWSAIADYLRNYRVFKCPSDQGSIVVSGAPLPRVRSYAMNVYAGTTSGTLLPTTGSGGNSMTLEEASEYLGYAKITSFLAPGPAQTFLLGDVNGNGQVAPAFGVSMDLMDEWTEWSGFPSTAHNMAGGFSLADGHVILKHWADPRTAQITYDQTTDAYVNTDQPGNPDVQWLRTVTTARRDGQPLKLSIAPSP